MSAADRIDRGVRSFGRGFQRGVAAGDDLGAFLAGALLGDGAPARTAPPDDLGALWLDAQDQEMSDAAVLWAHARVDRYGYHAPAHNVGRVLCCLPGPHGRHGAACMPCGRVRVQVFTDDLTAMRRLVSLARHATLGAEVESLGSIDDLGATIASIFGGGAASPAAGVERDAKAKDAAKSKSAQHKIAALTKKLAACKSSQAMKIQRLKHEISQLKAAAKTPGATDETVDFGDDADSSVGGYRSRDPNAPSLADVRGSDDLPDPGEDVPDIGDVGDDGFGEDDLAAVNESTVSVMLARNPTADPDALREWLHDLDVRGIVVLPEATLGPAGARVLEGGARTRHTSRNIEGSSAGRPVTVVLSFGGVRFWTARNDLGGAVSDVGGIFDAINPFAPSPAVEKMVQETAATWEGIDAEIRKQGKPHPEIASMRADWLAFWKKWQAGDRDVSGANAQAQQVNMARRFVLNIRQGDAADKPVIGVDPEKATAAREAAATVSDEAKRLEDDANKALKQNKGPIAALVTAAVAAVVFGLKVVSR